MRQSQTIHDDEFQPAFASLLENGRLLLKTKSEADAAMEEYGLEGNPTDPGDRGRIPVFGAVEDGGTNAFDYVYARRTGDSSLSYHLELTPNLIYSPWTNIGYTVTGTGPEVDGFDTVTNRTATDAAAKFIRLIIEQN